MTSSNVPAGIALWCDLEGRICQIVRDEFGVTRGKSESLPFHELCDPMSRDKFTRLLETVRKVEVACDWQLNLSVDGRIQLAHFAAVHQGERLFLVGTEEPDTADAYYEHLRRTNNHQATALHVVIEQLAQARARLGEPTRRAAENSGKLDLEQFTRLNNELMRVQRELAKRNIELERLNDEKNRFVAMASHDLRQPLAAISSLVQLLLSGGFGDLNPRQIKLLQTIMQSSDSMLELVNDLLDISVIESGRLELRYADIDVRQLVQRVRSMYEEHALSKAIDIQVALSPELPEAVWIDENRMAQVLGNLISNAIKYSYPGTEIQLSVICAGDRLEFAVTDRGQGIPQDEQERLFKPFSKTSVRTTAGESSTGLGLAIARQVVREHRGEISVVSKVGVGSTFRVSIPWRQPVS